jgi:hypothetical protein
MAGNLFCRSADVHTQDISRCNLASSEGRIKTEKLLLDARSFPAFTLRPDGMATLQGLKWITPSASRNRSSYRR